MPANSVAAAPGLACALYTTPGSDYFVVPSNCNLIFLSGCSSGGGGGGGDPTPGGGGGGGGAAPAYFRMPFVVVPGSTLLVVVADALKGGTAGNNGNAATVSGLGAISSISGPGILSPWTDFANLFELGQGGVGAKGVAAGGWIGGQSNFGSGQSAIVNGFTANGNGGKQYLLAGNVPLQFMLPFSQGGTGNTLNNTGGNVALGGDFIGSRVIGVGGTGSALGGGGGGGGGCPFGVGGAGGANGGAGANASGYGCGGGGGSGNNAGGNGSPGFIMIEY